VRAPTSVKPEGGRAVAAGAGRLLAAPRRIR
jgi:hypothetical protein